VRSSGQVRSTNLSLSALESGIEWNLRVDRDRDQPAFDRIGEAFEELWGLARPLDAQWVEDYAERAATAAPQALDGEVDVEPMEPPPDPHEVQVEALERLRQARAEGRKRALVVLPTGLGKTWLAAFDHAQLHDEMGRGVPRLLFLAHRRELLRQAAESYRRLARARNLRARVSWFLEEDSDLSGELVFASVAKAARQAHLARLAGERFDYVVVDEVHHAAADSYRRILRVLEPGFLLGLTATPDRADQADILGLFDDFEAYRADVGRGIELGRLVPFRYFGVKDEVDYDNIPWRNRRFDPKELEAAAQTEARMRTLDRAWDAHAGKRTLVFCCSIAHATFVREWLRGRGLRANAIFSGEGADDRDGSLRALSAGELDAVCSVDVLNEGVDLPDVDRVVMLRPTESSVVFLQQLGRGLRAADDKPHLTVIDFVGNHRIFIERLRSLLSLGGAPERATHALIVGDEPVMLPDGCSVELELEAKNLLSRFFRAGAVDEVERAYLELRAQRGARPTAGELQRMGYLPSRLRERYKGGWFELVRAQGDLAPDSQDATVVDEAGPFLLEVETTEMTKCFKMVTLEALLDAEALHAGLPLRDVDGGVWQFRFAKEFCNVARPVGTQRNQLPDLLRRWFGPRAGHPGTAFEVRFRAGPDGLWAEPIQSNVVSLEPRAAIVAYPDLRAAAGMAASELDPPEGEIVKLPIANADPSLFAVRVSGTSMDGGAAPLKDGDWAVMRLARGAAPSAVEGRVVLVQVPGDAGGTHHHLKRMVRNGAGWLLVSDNPEGPTIEPTTDMVVIARLERAIHPEELAPATGTVLGDDDLGAAFGIENLSPSSGRHEGHLFVFIAERGVLPSPDRVLVYVRQYERVPVASPRPAETAYVLAKRGDGGWRYLGVARPTRVPDDLAWQLPEVDYDTWRTWGEGREVSRPLPAGLLARAQRVVDALLTPALSDPDRDRSIEQPDGKRAHIIGRAPRGGLRIGGGPNNLAPRTISLVDLAWVIAAHEHVTLHGGLLDEPQVNRLRYLEGTPRDATRWIDTGWALAAWHRAVLLLRDEGWSPAPPAR
jgi:superfamily II DNA or RNA helicase/SOS-response transcriptional repressor LexA